MATLGTLVARLFWPVTVLIISIAFASMITDIHGGLGLPERSLIAVQKMAQVAIWLAGGWVFNRLTILLFWDGFVSRALNREPPRLIIQLNGVVVFLIVVSCILWFIFEKSVGTLWAASGAIGVVIGLALQRLILDTFSGVAIQLERPFKIGDWVKVHHRVGNFVGRVEETNWRTTRLLTTDDNIVIIPNSLITTTVLTNFSMPQSVASYEMDFVLDFSVPTERAERIFRAALASAIGPLGPLATPAPKVQINGVGQYGVEYQLTYHLDPAKVPPGTARDTITRAVLKHINQAGLSLSYPRQDLFLARMPWRHKSWHHSKDQIYLLGRLSIFSKLKNEDISYIAQHMSIHEFDAGTVVVRQDEEGDSMFILSEGMLEVLINQPDGAQHKIGEMTPGVFFGEKSLLTGQPRTATVRCVTDSVVCEITKSCMKTLLDMKPELAETLGRASIERDLMNEQTLSRATKEEVELKVSSTVSDLVVKIRQFFSR